MKKWDEITEDYLINMPMNFVIRTGKSNTEYNQAIRRVPNGWIFYEYIKKNESVVGTFVPEKR